MLPVLREILHRPDLTQNLNRRQVRQLRLLDSGVKPVSAVRALAPSGLQQPALPGRVQQAGQQPLRGLVLEQPGSELAQDRELEAGVGQVEGKQILPVDPASDGVGRLAVAQAFPELHEGHQRQ